MERESNYDNDVLDPFEEYFRKKKKVMMRKHIPTRRIKTATLLKGLVNLLKNNWQIRFWIFKIYAGVYYQLIFNYKTKTTLF